MSNRSQTKTYSDFARFADDHPDAADASRAEALFAAAGGDIENDGLSSLLEMDPPVVEEAMIVKALLDRYDHPHDAGHAYFRNYISSGEDAVTSLMKMLSDEVSSDHDDSAPGAKGSNSAGPSPANGRATLVSPQKNHRRRVDLSVGEVLRIEDGPRKVYVYPGSDGRLRVEMVDEEQNLIETEENNQPTYDNVNALLGEANS